MTECQLSAAHSGPCGPNCYFLLDESYCIEFIYPVEQKTTKKKAVIWQVEQKINQTCSIGQAHNGPCTDPNCFFRE